MIKEIRLEWEERVSLLVITDSSLRFNDHKSDVSHCSIDEFRNFPFLAAMIQQRQC